MLVLSRQRDETIMIGDDVEITVVDIRGDKVRIGIEAPAKIAVHRKEVYEAIREENERAARVESGELDGLAQRLRMIHPERGHPDGPHPDGASPDGADDAKAKAPPTAVPVRKTRPGGSDNAPADGRRRA